MEIEMFRKPFIAVDITDASGCWYGLALLGENHHTGAYLVCEAVNGKRVGRLSECKPYTDRHGDLYIRSHGRKYYIEAFESSGVGGIEMKGGI